ncbi:hypothetical protein AVEN_161874-1 [Araneus ventricosus]|uniref:ATP-dependent DNA helicase n=1 Tax=Araneus ventricosus TaxID=182803 RepID=A0A4Y2Q0Q6_ARAVE|nr:hypothetical protein AVEN_161874-1 [Araneus ventricosus]
MPERKRNSITQIKTKSKKAKLSRANEIDVQQQKRLQVMRDHGKTSQAGESKDQQQQRRQDTERKVFIRRKGTPVFGCDVVASEAIRHVYTVHPNNSECFFLRTLLHTIKGPTSYAMLKTVDGRVCNTFRETCQKLVLLEDDVHWTKTMSETTLTSSPDQIRNLFAIILTTCNPSNPSFLWDKFRESMSEDILSRLRRSKVTFDIKFSSELGLQSPERNLNITNNADLLREKNYNTSELGKYVEYNKPLLTYGQSKVYDHFMECIKKERRRYHFPRRSRRNCSYSHGWWKDPALGVKAASKYKWEKYPACNISKTSGLAKVLRTCKILVWNECTMVHKKSLEALGRTLRDLRKIDQLVGKSLLLFNGDFRQTLSVIQNSADELKACLKTTSLWKLVKRFTLKVNHGNSAF